MSTCYRVIVLGIGEVGKTALLKRYIGEEFPLSYIHTIEDTYSTNVPYEHFMYKLDIIDTDGKGEENLTRSMYYTQGHSFIIVYDITSRESFLRVKKTYQCIRTARRMDDSMSLPVVIVANKSDLSQHRVVQMGEGEILARALKASYIETSAKYNINVDEVFTTLITEIRDQTKILVKKSKKKSSCSCM
ncbi:GTP-binding protein Rit1 isoform X1 [Oopsacas minuta]|uniref:GTP-binding protein Rit1 isoform X1 n=1 Tax=Oopsacas minuta TaxID=111878 RepID=A0AAV7KR55_9METZ|nr:GTP-binding protein Rit1 isoform X1 [Oopsacas minuta]